MYPVDYYSSLQQNLTMVDSQKSNDMMADSTEDSNYSPKINERQFNSNSSLQTQSVVTNFELAHWYLAPK